MSCEHIYTYVNPVRDRDIDKALNLLANDGLIAYPTDISWAFGCDPRRPKAVSRLKALKPAHPKHQPFSLLCSSIAMASRVANVDSFAYPYLKKLLPGPYTILLQRNPSLPKQLDDKRRVVGIRFPDCELVNRLVDRLDYPLLSTSVPTSIAGNLEVGVLHYGYEIADTFGHTLDLILDLGEEVIGRETTVIDLSEGEAVLVRQGLGNVDHLNLKSHMAE